MKISNHDISLLLNQTADFLEVHADNPYRVRAYRRAAGKINVYPKNIWQLVEENYDLTQIPKIGKHLAERIIEIVKTGKTPPISIKKSFNKSYKPGKPYERIFKIKTAELL